MATTKPTPLWVALKSQRATPTDVLVRLGMVTPPVNAQEVAEQIGCVVHHVPDPGWSGALTVKDNHAVIWVNMGESPERKSFTIAHEIGHLLQHDTTHAFRDVTYDGTPQESEANRFAADLLMPMWMVGPIALSVTEENIQHFAAHFGVSVSAMRRRIMESIGVSVPPL